jgi:hypothetical protein
MAGRTSASFGVAATITVLAITTLGFFVSFAIYFGKYNDREQKLKLAQQQISDYVRTDEQNQDNVRNLVEEAKKDGRKSLVGYLVANREAMMQKITGSGRDSLADLATKLKDVPGAESSALVPLIRQQQQQISSLGRQLEDADKARLAAQADQQNEARRVADIEAAHQKTVDSLNAMIRQYRDELDGYRKGADDYKKKVDAQLDGVKQSAAESEARLNEQLKKLNEEKLIIESQLNALRAQKNLAIVRPGDEAALVDGTVIATDGSARQAFISLGARNHVVLGMTFSVYSNAEAIRPDAEGNYPRGKATLEVTSVGDASSTCRITSEVRGNPVVKGDVIANAVYDPNKTYKFVVYGNFDANRDGAATSLEREDVKAMIAGWGGTVIDDLTGEADFLVLGERPITPPRPSSAAPLELILEYQRREQEAQRFDLLFRQAQSTSVPVLNENRLYTLIGKTPASNRR